MASETTGSGAGVGRANTAATVALFVAILLVAGALTFGLIQLKKSPAQAEIHEIRHQVEVTRVAAEAVPVVITGYGEAKSLHVIQIIPEVPGRIVQMHEHLFAGEVIPKGELLFQIDPRDYLAARDQAQAQVTQAEKSIERLTRQYAIDQERLVTLRRSRELSQTELNRRQTLLKKDDVGTQSGVDQAELAYNQTNDLCDQLAQAVELYPIRIKEAESGLKAAQAQLTVAETNLERTTFNAPFNARIKLRNLEVGQYVAPGAPVLTIADDSTLEISVPLDSRDARSWLQFSTAADFDENSWFGALEQVRCKIIWTEDREENAWYGMLDRVERFDQVTRTVTVAIRISGEDARSSKAGLPLVDGMFCQVELPGKTMEGVYRLPRWAVSFEGQVFLARPGAQVASFTPEAISRAQLQELLGGDGEAEGSEEIWKKICAAVKSAGTGAELLEWRTLDALPGGQREALEGNGGELSKILESEGKFLVVRHQYRLHRQDVVVARSQHEESFIQAGLKPGDLVVVTRLVNPMPNSLLTFVNAPSSSVPQATEVTAAATAE